MISFPSLKIPTIPKQEISVSPPRKKEYGAYCIHTPSCKTWSLNVSTEFKTDQDLWVTLTVCPVSMSTSARPAPLNWKRGRPSSKLWDQQTPCKVLSHHDLGSIISSGQRRRLAEHSPWRVHPVDRATGRLCRVLLLSGVLAPLRKAFCGLQRWTFLNFPTSAALFNET
jgi:hypothetical protein